MNEINQDILSLDDIYFKDAFTKTEDKLNLEVNNADIDCMTSRNNKFSLDSEGNLIVKTITADSINIQNVLDMVYPIGSIYTSKMDINPSTLFGGVWEQIKDTFLLCAGDKYPAGTTGGEETHTLTIDEMPNHQHKINGYKGGNQWAIGNIWFRAGDTTSGNTAASGNTGSNGLGKAHNNMPPYQAIYAWERIS